MLKISENLEKTRKNAPTIAENLKNAGKTQENAPSRAEKEAPKGHPKRPETGAE